MKVLTKKQSEIKISEGSYTEQMPLLVKTGFTPATVADVINLELRGQLSFEEHYDTVSAIAYAGNNKSTFKIIPFSEALKDITKETKLHDGGIKLTQEQYDKIQAKEFERKDIIISKKLTQNQVLEHKGWQALIEDKELLKKYVEAVFKQVLSRSKEKETMGFYIGGPQKESILRHFFLGKFGTYIVGNYNLVGGRRGRLVGYK